MVDEGEDRKQKERMPHRMFSKDKYQEIQMGLKEIW